MVFNIKYLFCLSIVLTLFKPWARTELLEINDRIIDMNDFITNEEKRLEALNSHLMTAEECYSLCKAFYSRSDLANTLAWSMETLRKYKEETTEEHSFTEVDVLEYIAYAHYLMGNIQTALGWTKKILKLDPNHPRAVGNVPQYEDLIAEQEKASKKLEDTEDEKANAIKLSEEMHQLNVAKIQHMTAADCFELSKVFYNKRDYNHSLTWGMESLRKYKEETEEHWFTEVDVLEYIAFTHYLMGDVKTALKWTKELLKLDPNHPRAAGNIPRYEHIAREGDKLSEEMHQFDVAKSLQMTAANCFEVGKVLYHKNEYNNSLAWNMESLRKYKNETTEEHSFTEVDVLEYIAFTHYLMGDVKLALKWTIKLLELDPNHPQALANMPHFEQAIADKETATNKRGDTGDQCDDETDESPKFEVAKSQLMTAQECFNLCKGFYLKNEFNNALVWGMEALRKYKEETDKKHSFTEVEVLEYIAFLHNIMGDVKSALDWTKTLLNLDPNHPRAASNLPIFEKAIAEQEAATKKRGDTGDEFEVETTEDETEEMLKSGNAISHLMTAEACFKVCKEFYFKNDFKTSLVWSMETLHKYNADTNKRHSFTEVDVLEYIGYSHYMMGDFKTALEWTQKLLKLDPNNPRAAGVEKAIAEKEAAKKKRLGTGVPTDDEKAKPEQIIPKFDNHSPSYREVLLRYEALCRGEMEINSDVAKRLFCRYMSEHHPFLRLAPIKTEQVFIDPDVFVFHGVLSDDEIQVIKVLSMPRLQRATVGSDLNENEFADYRISKSAWLNDEESQVVARVSRRVSDMTGLSMESAEKLQVVNYGIGGHYEPHFDFAEMSDVAQGGATVFTELGLSVLPARGAALYFINLLPSGEGDLATGHGACPVLRGSKWVCNKWIHEGGQELTRPCGCDCQREESFRKIPPFSRSDNT